MWVTEQRGTRPDSGAAEVALARTRVVRTGATGRPARHEPKVSRKAPAPVGLEHPVLEDIAPRVCPVVRYLATGVVPHEVRVVELAAARQMPVAPTCADEARAADADEPVHFPSVDVAHPRERAVGAAGVDVTPVVEGPDALAETVRHACLPRDPVCTRKCAE